MRPRPLAHHQITVLVYSVRTPKVLAPRVAASPRYFPFVSTELPSSLPRRFLCWATPAVAPCRTIPPPAPQSPISTIRSSTLLSQLALAQAADLVPDACGARHMHNRTAIILHRTCTPTPLNSGAMHQRVPGLLKWYSR